LHGEHFASPDGLAGLTRQVAGPGGRQAVPQLLHGHGEPFMFLSFDGVDGVGKTTQIQLFCDWLKQQGHDVVTCRDPGSTQLGEALRAIVLQDFETPIDRTSEMLLYMASRAQLVHEVIRPALAQRKTVVSDRFLLANVVYQGYAGGLDVQRLWQVGEVAVGGLHPDLTIVLDMDVASAQQRMDRQLDRMEAQGHQYLQLVRQGFLAEADGPHEKIVVVNADQGVDEVQADIRSAFMAWLKQRQDRL
jgi:dTMP kinase